VFCDLVGFTQRDGAMTLFGVPVAHEDDSERAVRASLRVLERLPSLGLDLQARLASTREKSSSLRITPGEGTRSPVRAMVRSSSAEGEQGWPEAKRAYRPDGSS